MNRGSPDTRDKEHGVLGTEVRDFMSSREPVDHRLEGVPEDYGRSPDVRRRMGKRERETLYKGTEEQEVPGSRVGEREDPFVPSTRPQTKIGEVCRDSGGHRFVSHTGPNQRWGWVNGRDNTGRVREWDGQELKSMVRERTGISTVRSLSPVITWVVHGVGHIHP